MTDRTSQPPLELFYSYAEEDGELRYELEKHLSMLKRQRLISDWHFRKIGPGTEWKGSIDDNLDKAHIILLLISADFLASDYCYDVEMKRAMQRHESGQARVIPVVLRAVDWEGAPFRALQALPTSAKPVTAWRDRDEAFADIAKGIRKAVQELTVASMTETIRKATIGPLPVSLPILVQPNVASRNTDPSARNQVPATSTLFVWTAVTSAVCYELQVSLDATFADPNKIIINKTGANKLANQLAYVSEVTLKAATAYFWRVRAISGTSDGSWSAVAAFVTTGLGATIPVAEATHSIASALDVLLVFDNSSLIWQTYVHGAPAAAANTLHSVMPGTPVWIKVNAPIFWTRGLNSVALVPGWNLVLVP